VMSRSAQAGERRNNMSAGFGVPWIDAFQIGLMLIIIYQLKSK